MGRTISVQGLGNRSGHFDARSVEARAAELIARNVHHVAPRGLLGPSPGSTTEFVARRAMTEPYTKQVNGARTDSPGGPAGTGPRVVWGLLSDGSYGIERFDAGGTRSIPIWT